MKHKIIKHAQHDKVDFDALHASLNREVMLEMMRAIKETTTKMSETLEDIVECLQIIEEKIKKSRDWGNEPDTTQPKR